MGFPGNHCAALCVASENADADGGMIDRVGLDYVTRSEVPRFGERIEAAPVEHGSRLDGGTRGDEFGFRWHDHRGAQEVRRDLPVGGASGPASAEEHSLTARSLAC